MGVVSGSESTTSIDTRAWYEHLYEAAGGGGEAFHNALRNNIVRYSIVCMENTADLAKRTLLILYFDATRSSMMWAFRQP